MNFFRQHMGTRLLALVAVMVVVGMLAQTIWYAKRQTDIIREINESQMAKLADSVDHGLQTLMIAGYADIAQSFAGGLKQVPEIADFRIMRTNGLEAFRDNETIITVNRHHDEGAFDLRDEEIAIPVLDESDVSLRTVVESEAALIRYETSGQGDTLLTFLLPVLNQEECHECHSDDHRVRGVIKLTMSLASLEQRTFFTIVELFLWFALTAVGVLLVIWYFIRRVVTLRVESLTHAMGEASRGTHDVRLSVQGEDELSDMTRSFNRMMDDLKITQAGLTREHATLSTIIRSVRDGIIATNGFGDIVLVNPAAQEMLGKDNHELIRDGFESILDDPELIRQALSGEDADEGMMEIEYRGRNIAFYVTNIPGAGGKLLGSAVILRDVTLERSLDAELDQQINELSKAHGVIANHSERVGRELKLGHDIQQGLLTRDFISAEDGQGIALHALMSPANEVGGDFYEFFFQDADHLCFYIGDVSGKGVPAALFMAVAKSLIRSRASYDHSTASTMTHINAELALHNESMMFVTVFLCVLNTRTGHLQYTNAGHNPPYLMHADGQIEPLVGIDGAASGVIGDLVYTEQHRVLKKDDRVLLYTDGVTEALDINQHLFGEERLEEYLENTRFGSCKELVLGVNRIVEEYELGSSQSDDITLLAVEMVRQPVAMINEDQHLEIINRLAQIQAVFNWTAALRKDSVFSRGDELTLNLVFDEILTNVISYGYEDAEDHLIVLKLRVSDSRILVTIIDDGVDFNPLNASDPETQAPLEERRIGGLGLHVVREVMDHLAYKRVHGRNQLTMIRFRHVPDETVADD